MNSNETSATPIIFSEIKQHNLILFFCVASHQAPAISGKDLPEHCLLF